MKKQKQAKLFSKKTQNKSKKKENSKKGNIQIVEQKEPSQKIEDILNHPISKRRLPPIEKRENTETNEPHEEEKIEDEIENNNNNFNLEDEINNNIQNLNFIENENEEQIKDSLEIENIMEKNKNIEEVSTIVKNTVDNVEKKINIIEKKMMAYFEELSNNKKEDNSTEEEEEKNKNVNQNQETTSGAFGEENNNNKIKEKLREPFAKIVNVEKGSPADEAGLKAEDDIIVFNGILYKGVSYNPLNTLSDIVRSKIGQKIPVSVIRKNSDNILEVVNLEIIPHTWNGRGVLGCKFQIIP